MRLDSPCSVLVLRVNHQYSSRTFKVIHRFFKNRLYKVDKVLFYLFVYLLCAKMIMEFSFFFFRKDFLCNPSWPGLTV